MGNESLHCAAVQAGLISAEDIIIDAKSGVSGAGRSAKQNLLYTEIAEGINCYGVGSHRHMPEIEQAWPWAFGNLLRESTDGLHANHHIRYTYCCGSNKSLTQSFVGKRIPQKAAASAQAVFPKVLKLELGASVQEAPALASNGAGGLWLQGLSEAAGADVRVSFTPHLMPMSRGMQSTIYVRLDGSASVDDLRSTLQVCAH